MKTVHEMQLTGLLDVQTATGVVTQCRNRLPKNLRLRASTVGLGRATGSSSWFALGRLRERTLGGDGSRRGSILRDGTNARYPRGGKGGTNKARHRWACATGPLEKKHAYSWSFLCGLLRLLLQGTSTTWSTSSLSLAWTRASDRS